MGEPYRTLLGHFRHEIGHFYWECLIASGPWLVPFREMFGDETENYAAALQNHYQAEPDPDRRQQYISTYASTNPWEDWAETWAHYMHIMDALKTAPHWGDSIRTQDKPSVSASVKDPEAEALKFRSMLIHQWLPLITQFMNSINRSLGQRDSYPFVLGAKGMEKLGFVYQVGSSGRAICPKQSMTWADWPPPCKPSGAGP